MFLIPLPAAFFVLVVNEIWNIHGEREGGTQTHPHDDTRTDTDMDACAYTFTFQKY